MPDPDMSSIRTASVDWRSVSGRAGEDVMSRDLDLPLKEVLYWSLASICNGLSFVWLIHLNGVIIILIVWLAPWNRLRLGII